MEKFVLREALELPKLGLKAQLFQHSSGLQHLHVRRPDPNLVWSLAFRTQAPDRTGVPHILEHTTLCGSHKYPVRDPFFKMQTRSLANFMNAMTGLDYTYYPFATTNRADFANLQQVYCDSVFSPLLSYSDFRQEGWRLERSSGKSPWELKGVVFNEMKGQMSMPAYQFWSSWYEKIYESMKWAAGDPLKIPDLTWQDLRAFHNKNYCASNCFTYSYGNIDIEEAVQPLLPYIDNSVSTPVHDTLPQPLSLQKNTSVVVDGPVDPMFDSERGFRASITWYLGEPESINRSVVWRVLALLLTDGHAAPFAKALLDSGMAAEFSVNTGFEETPAQLMFTVGVQGIAESRLGEFRDVVHSVLREVSQTGFSQSRVDAIMHQAELADKEVDANFGMNLLERVVSRSFRPPPSGLLSLIDNESILNQFRNEYRENPNLFKNEISKLLESPTFEFTVRPREDYDVIVSQKEKDVLESKVSLLTAADEVQLDKDAKSLAEEQAAPQNVDILPAVTRKDISEQAPVYPVTTAEGVIQRKTGTQGISYIKLLRDISGLPHDLLSVLPLYTQALTNVGTSSHDMATLEDLIRLYTGGIGSGSAVRHWGALEIGYGGSALDRNLPHLYALLEEIATQPKLDNTSKLKQLVDASAASTTDALSSSGHRYALNRALAAVNTEAALSDRISGLSGHIQLVQKLSNEGVEELVPLLKQIHELPWTLRSIGVTHSPGVDHTGYIRGLVNSVEASMVSSSSYAPVALTSTRTHVDLPFQVSHVGTAIATTTRYQDPDAAALQVLAQLVTHRHLHSEIRERGGAYGGGASFNPLKGTWSTYSYRDPAPNNSLAIMREAGEWASRQKWERKDIDEGLVAIFQGLDAPISPRSEINAALSMISDEQRQKRRSNLLAVLPDDLQRVAEKYLVTADPAQCVVGPLADAEDWHVINL